MTSENDISEKQTEGTLTRKKINKNESHKRGWKREKNDK